MMPKRNFPLQNAYIFVELCIPEIRPAIHNVERGKGWEEPG